MDPLHTFSPILNPVLSTSIHSLFESAEPTVSRVIRVINSIVLVYTFPICPLPPTLPLCYNVVPLPHRRVPFVYRSQFQPQFQRELDVCLDPFPWARRACRAAAEMNRSQPDLLSVRSCSSPPLPPATNCGASYGTEPTEGQAKKARQTGRMPATHAHTHTHTHTESTPTE